MTLHKRTLLIIGLTFLGLIATLYAASQLIVLDGFARQEERGARRNIERVRDTLAESLTTLQGTTKDWAYWDDTYAYIDDQNEDYFNSNLNGATAIASNRLNVMAFVHSTGRLIFAKGYDIAAGVPMPFPESLRAHIAPHSLLTSHSELTSTIAGVLSLPEGPMVLASASILTSGIQGPSRGTLIFGRYLNKDEIARMATTTHLDLSAYQIDDPAMPQDFKEVASQLSPTSAIVRPLSDTSVAGYFLLNDIYGKPALIFRETTARDVYTQGKTTVLYLMIALVGVALVFGVVMSLLLERVILSRLARLRTKVSAITASGDLSSRISDFGFRISDLAGDRRALEASSRSTHNPKTEVRNPKSEDELGSLAMDINGMLAALDASQRERLASESRYRVLMEQAADGIAVYDFEGNIVQANQRACEMLGYTHEEMLRLTLPGIVDPDDMLRTPIRFDELLTGKVVISERVLKRKDGTCLPTEISAKILSSQDGVQAIVRDITERKDAEKALRQERDFSDSLINSSVDGIMAFDRECRYTVWNPSMERMTGLMRDQVLGKSAFDVFPYLKKIGQDEYFYAALAGKTVLSKNSPYNVPETGNEGFYEGRYSPLHNRDGEVIGGLAIINDVTERRALEEQLAHQAFHDALTGLSNRTLFMDRLKHALDRSARKEDSVAILFLDLDDFKVINDSLGHKAGDQLLIEMSERLQMCVRTGDTVARLGGDEFTVLLEEVEGLHVAECVAARIAEQLQTPFNLDGHEVFVTTSIGIAFSGPDSKEPDDLLRDADVAMYEAKNRGKSRSAVFNSEMNTRAWRRLEMEIELRRALDRGDFSVNYQPVVRLDTGEIVEVEALVRWDHKSGRLIAPTEFIPVAEETGLILPLGKWVLQEACKQVLAWQKANPLRQPLILSVNMSARQLKDPRLVENITSDLKEIGFDPSLLKLEITESVALDDTDVTIATLHQLRDLGIHLAIDDFGTGYSALSYLKRFPVDTLKIDRSFVDGLGRDLEDTAIVRAVVAFAKTLSLTVTAEGIETAEQLVHLQELGCECGQGYYFAKPLPGYAMQELLDGSTLLLPLVADAVAV